MMKPLHWLAAAALSLGLSASAAAQNGTIRGTVSSNKGETLPGVSVKVEGKSYAVVTNAGGAYQLSVPAGTYKLVVSGMGYKGANKTGTVLAGKDLTLNFILSEDVSVLDDVVVIGYGQSSTKDLTGSLVSVKSRSFQRGAFSTPEQLIVGKTPGVRITSNSGQPGAGSRIRIRGGSSLNASNDPLVVIDGLPADGLGLINPADIESFTILKDASAAAIYGSRAANGVILVTTKKGAAGKAFNADLNVVYSVRNNRNQVNVLDADEFANAINTYGTKAQIARLATAPGWAKVDRNGVSTFDSIIPTDSATRTNWQDVIYQTGMVQDVNIAFTGGIKNLPYRLSLGRYHETGVLRRSELARYSASLNASPELIKGKLKANFAGKLINSTQNYSNTGAIGTAVTFDPTRPVYSGDTSLGGYFEWIRNNEPNGLSPKNPLGLIEQRTDIGHNTRLLGNVLFDYKATADDKLHLYLNMGGELSNTNGDFFTPASAAAQWFQGGEKGQYASTRTNRLLEAYFNYKTNLSANIKTDLIGGYSFQHWSTTSPTFPVLNADGSDTIAAPAANDFFTENALMSFYGRWNVNAYDKYLFTFTLRQDGSSRFSKESRWGLFPSAAVAHNLLKESFLAGNTTFSTLKWRAGWGIVGQQDIFNDYAYIPNYMPSSSTASYQFGNDFVTMLRPDAYDYNLQWEKTATTNIGLDFGFLKNRINGAVDVYQKYTYDLLG
ncbi:MAG: SusC/RagA family TonB-linked outer membrane protein, partial [Schleiferiaceae bacterium]|nr:SusC/RagA family TonB-linked outer membrane protein [Schleiferiaceae bacterium]MDP4627028.1 SusC/RagA family TonB-linked outer membrane protein [Schleiferiaceae bacterium]MDP4901606.1 SusC/RagA family TonB-linked outer membrane protein [Schleiferiaceae bacterium]